MDKIKYILNSSWRWLVTVPLGIFTAYNIIRQEINPKLPPLINFISGWHWGIWLSLFLLALALIIMEGLSRHKKEDKLPIVKAKTKRGGQSIVIGKNNFGTTNQTFNTEQVQKTVPANWNSVKFEAWNPRLSDSVKGGVVIINNKHQSINDCYAELIEIYEEIEREYTPCYGERKAELPCLLGWEISNETIYEKIEIESTKQRYLGISYTNWIMSGSEYYVIKGKNFTYAWPNNGNVIAEIEISSKINGESPRPKRLFVKMSRQNNRFKVVEVTNEFPKTKKVNVAPYNQPKTGETRQSSIYVVNKENGDLAECIGILTGGTYRWKDGAPTDLRDSIVLPRQFAWSAKTRKDETHFLTIRPGDNQKAILDIARANNGNIVFTFADSDDERNLIGLYEIIIEISGNFDGHPFQSGPKYFTLEFRGGDSLSIRETNITDVRK